MSYSLPLAFADYRQHIMAFYALDSTRKSKLSRLKSLVEFCDKYQITGLKDIDLKVINRYHQYLLRLKYHLVTANKAVKDAKQFLRWLIFEGHIEYSSAFEFRLPSERPNPICFLREDQIQRLIDLPLQDKHTLDKVRDCFLFQVYTGLAYIDLANFSYKGHIHTLSGKQILVMPRAKTHHIAQIPLLKPALAILEKWDFALPVMTNQRYNLYLKQLGRLIQLPFSLSSHIGRKTAATLFLNHDISLKAVSQALGHSDSKTTERYYAALHKDTLLREFEKVA